MKILFYDIREFELNYLLEKISSNIEPYYFKTALNSNVYIDEKYKNTQAISVFVNSKLDSAVLSKFPDLKFIFLRCVGYSNVDLKYCKENDIFVFNTPNYGNSTVAEYTFGLILALCRKIIQSKEDLQQGQIDTQELRGIELYGKTLGVVGAGAIGRKVIDIAKGFEMETLVFDTNQNGNYNYVDFEKLLRESDFISINCPLTPTTQGMFGKEAFSMMKSNAIITNTARGEIIDTQALYWALANKKIQGAALDVVECEEILCQNWKNCTQDDTLRLLCLKKFFFVDKLMKMNNVIITPHNAYNTSEAQKRILNITLTNIQSSFNFNAGAKNLVLI